MGLLIENLAAAHMYSLSQQAGVRLYHWRDKKAEVDLVFDHPDEPMAFEVTGSDYHHIKGLDEFVERFPKFRGSTYLVSNNSIFQRPTLDSPGRIPFEMFLLACGMQTQRAMEDRTGVRMDKNGQYMLFRK